MGASKHLIKGLCTPKMEPIHKINYIKRRLTKVRTVPPLASKKKKKNITKKT